MTEEKSITVRNEQIKLSANFMNILGASTANIGVLAPVIAAIVNNDGPSFNMIATIGWLFGAWLLHMFGKSLLGSLEEAE